MLVLEYGKEIALKAGNNYAKDTFDYWIEYNIKNTEPE
jgi:hypothetical protein